MCPEISAGTHALLSDGSRDFSRAQSAGHSSLPTHGFLEPAVSHPQSYSDSMFLTTCDVQSRTGINWQPNSNTTNTHCAPLEVYHSPRFASRQLTNQCTPTSANVEDFFAEMDIPTPTLQCASPSSSTSQFCNLNAAGVIVIDAPIGSRVGAVHDSSANMWSSVVESNNNQFATSVVELSNANVMGAGVWGISVGSPVHHCDAEVNHSSLDDDSCDEMNSSR